MLNANATQTYKRIHSFSCPPHQFVLLESHVTLSRSWFQWTHEYVPSAALSEILWHAKDFPMSPKVDANAGETQPGFMLWHMMRSRMSQCFYDVVWCFYDHFWTLGECEACLIVCSSSVVNFGTVWRQQEGPTNHHHCLALCIPV